MEESQRSKSEIAIPNMRPRISAVIMTLNEEKNIGNALRSVAPWVDEIIVVDMYSDDRTVEIAHSFGAKVFLHEKKRLADPARNFSQEKATGDWIIALDADEIVPPKLSRELLKIAEDDRADICFVPELNYFCGFPLLHTGWGPDQDRHDRFYRKGSIVYSPNIHGRSRQKEGSRVLSLKYRPGLAIIHFNFLNVSHCVEKLNRYTDIDASQKNQKGQKMGAVDMLIRPLWEFVKRYFRYQGFRDGWPGLYYSFFMSFYRMTQAMKLREIDVAGSAEAVRTKYQTIAEEYLAGYESQMKPSEPH